ncbi:MAG: sterol desaturase family protein [Acidimicrobiia bacterium]
MAFAVITVATFLFMEPITALTHRFVMHGFGTRWHVTHHRPPRGRFERNDLFPVVFSLITIGVFALGAFVPGLWFLMPIGTGITAYGIAYMIVHDVIIHARVPFIRVSPTVARYWRESHNVHHVFGAAPYGFLAPVVPAELRTRAAAPDAPLPDRITRPASAQRVAKTSRV